ncbi:MAG: HEAT repeat domain-containing protein [Planctomycetota bacterium]
MSTVLILTASFLLPLVPHGGAYRGPLRPGSSKSGGRVPGPSTGKGVPAPPPGTQPVTPSPNPGASYGALEHWHVWWEFNKDPYLWRAAQRSRSAPLTGVPRKSDGDPAEATARRLRLAPDLVGGELEPALVRLLEDRRTDREVVASSLIALARLARDPSVLAVIQKHLGDPQLGAETAALALGIAGFDAAADSLLELALDRPAARKLVKKSRVPYRTRSFACYGLALLCRRSTSPYLKMRVFRELRSLFDAKARTRQDLMVAALHTLRLFELGGSKTGSLGEGMVLGDVKSYLLDLLGRKRRLPPLVRAHAVTALAEIAGRNTDTESKLRLELLKLLGSRRENPWVRQSVVIGLGKVIEPGEREFIQRLGKYLGRGRDRLARNLAAISLGRIGGDRARTILLEALRSRRTLDRTRPWIALGLAIMIEKADRGLASPPGDRTAGEAILARFRETGNQIQAAGLAIALGIMRYGRALPLLTRRLGKTQDLARGYLVQAIGLIGDPESREPLMKVAKESLHRPEVLSRAALALGMLGDKDIASWLLELIDRKGQSMHVQAGVAQALGHVGGNRDARQLLFLLRSKKRSDFVKSFVVVALGLMGEKTRLPWHSYLSVDINYIAGIETLYGDGTGVLELL